MKHLKEFTIPFVGLKDEKHHFDFEISNTFFDSFNYHEFNSSNVTVNLTLDKKSTHLELHFWIKGIVNINCDITNEPYDQDITSEFDLVVKFGEEFNGDHEEILIIPHGEYELHLEQYCYEFIVLTVPTKRVHPGVEDGSLNSEILKKLEELSPKNKESKNKDEEIDPRWNTLKKLLTDK
jgi:uncharacterized metal-binding protein YceD (DUF177 family)